MIWQKSATSFSESQPVTSTEIRNLDCRSQRASKRWRVWHVRRFMERSWPSRAVRRASSDREGRRKFWELVSRVWRLWWLQPASQSVPLLLSRSLKTSGLFETVWIKIRIIDKMVVSGVQRNFINSLTQKTAACSTENRDSMLISRHGLNAFFRQKFTQGYRVDFSYVFFLRNKHSSLCGFHRHLKNVAFLN